VRSPVHIDILALTNFYAATPPPDSYGNFENMPFKKAPTNGSGFLKPARAMPPRVDTSAASMWARTRD
jgi:hypothetical protein